MKIGLDIMGGDFAPNHELEAAVQAVSSLPDSCKIVLFGDSHAAQKYLTEKNINPSLFDYVHTTEVIQMGEHPTKAISQKPNASIPLGFKHLKDNNIQAFISGGNTGAMMVGAMFSVKVVSGVIRPSIGTLLPKQNGSVGFLLDVGTNADCKPDVLYQFGTLGSLFVEHVYKINKPKVALLNIGEEPEKGNLVSLAAYNMMKDSKDFNFVGNVEGRDLFDDKADVVVCEGFTGNVVLKNCEAFYTMIKHKKIQDDFFDRFNYEIYGGTPILGINSTVIICHGISSPLAIKNSILLAKEIHEANLPEKIKTAFN
ncbi:MAG: phosphate acyltransferase PlsX [Bacteroidetes bacterium]|nr:phosphate acyltransferase PlsX [Bacteroidota bacterium]